MFFEELGEILDILVNNRDCFGKIFCNLIRKRYIPLVDPPIQKNFPFELLLTLLKNNGLRSFHLLLHNLTVVIFVFDCEVIVSLQLKEEEREGN